ncbi:MAG TPA: dephospho-CoA kinase [Actinospica sp.]|jgi:dephospho-CoA kinase|nr:dephospho-CoA kinase [Actinospica sp.]
MRTVHVGLTGGIGAGKSSVARLLAERGAVVLDADLAARAVVEPGTDGLAEVVAAFGTDVLAADGGLDRAKLAAVVFADAERRAALNAIVHPRVRAWMAERAAAAPAGSVVVQDIPLLVESGLVPLFDHVVVVDAADGVRMERLMKDRGMTAEQAQARIDAQAPAQVRNAAAHTLIRNDGSRADLAEAVARLWHKLDGLRVQS